MILRTLLFAPLRAHPGRFLLTAAGVAIGVASLVSTLLASRSAVAFLGEDVLEIAGAARIEVAKPGGLEPADLAALAPFAGRALVAPVIEDVVLAPALGELVRLLGVDLLCDSGARELALADPERTERGPAGLAPELEALLLGRAVALSAGLARELGLAPGAELELVVRSRRETVRIAALFEPARFASAWDRVVLADVALADELLGRGGRVDRAELVPRAGVAAELLAGELEAALPAALRVRTPELRAEQGRRMVAALEFNLTALSGVALLVAVVLVATALATSIAERKEAIALLSSLGASRAQLAGAVAAEAAAIGAAGGALGALAGTWGAGAALESVRGSVATIAQGSSGAAPELTAGLVLTGIALGLGTGVAAALLPLREALSTPPIQSLRRGAPEPAGGARAALRRALASAALLGGALLGARLPPFGERPIWALGAALCLLALLLVLAPLLIDLAAGWRAGGSRWDRAPTLRLAQAALAAGRRRAAWAAGAVGVAVALAVAMATMVGSFRQTLVDWSAQALRSDLYVRPAAVGGGARARGLDASLVGLAEQLFGAGSVDPFYATSAELGREAYTLAGAAFEVAAREGGVPFVDGRDSRAVFAEAAARRGAVVNEPFARRFGLGRGDRLELDTRAGTVEREIVGVYRDYSGHTGRAVLDRADFLALYPERGPESLSIFLGEGADPEAARRSLAAAIGARFAVETLLHGELRREVLAIFERTFAVTIALQVVASVVAAIAVVSVLAALLREQSRDLAVVRVLGGSRAQLAGAVACQALLLALAGALGGLAIGLAVGWVLVRVLNVQSFGWTLAFLPPWGAILGTVAATLPACLAAALFPIVAALRKAPREALHELG